MQYQELLSAFNCKPKEFEFMFSDVWRASDRLTNADLEKLAAFLKVGRLVDCKNRYVKNNK